jgi:Ni,Fe-hydrogenase III large subunit
MTPPLHAFLGEQGRATAWLPWPRFAMSQAAWLRLRDRLGAEPDWALLGLWGDDGHVHGAFRDERDGAIAVATLACRNGAFPSLAGMRPSAIRLERAIQDLYGFKAEGLNDQRPWLDHGRWRLARPLSGAPETRDPPLESAETYPFLAVEGEGLHQIPVGPVHAGIIEPGHFRFTANGETVARLEERLGYVHKGTEGLMAGRGLADASRLAARISGDSTVAHSLAFARAAEAALGVEAPPRAHFVRALMAELERVANHFGDVGAICNDASFGFIHAHCGVLRERTLRAARIAFGHRLMMDRVVAGGVTDDLSAEGEHEIRGLVAAARPAFARLVRVYDRMASLADRTVSTGITAAPLVRRFAAGGHVGRAAGRGHDARKSPAYPPYDGLDFAVPVLHEGDVNARIWIRIREVEASLGLIEQILDGLPAGPVRVELPRRAGEGMALVESFRGEILAYLRIGGDGLVARGHLRDPSWFQWPLLEAAIEGNIVADFPLCNKSFNCSYSGHDL